MRLKPNYFLIPLITVIVAVLGSYFSSVGMRWYETQIIKPVITPPNWAFPLAWNIIFVLATISALIIWNRGSRENKILAILLRKKSSKKFWIVIGLFIFNALLNLLWSLFFFTFHLIEISFYNLIILEITTVLIMIFSWSISKFASLLLLPYVLWVGWAGILLFQILALNAS